MTGARLSAAPLDDSVVINSRGGSRCINGLSQARSQLAPINATLLTRTLTPVSYTHLTLPTNREV